MHATYERIAIARYKLLQHQRKNIEQESIRPMNSRLGRANIRRLLGSCLIGLGKKLSRSGSTVMGISPQPTKS